MNTVQKIGLGAGAAVLGVGSVLGLSQLAFAETTASPTPSASTGAEPGHAGRGHRGDNSQLAADLATKLGVEQDAVATALSNAREASKPAAGERPDAATRDAALAKALATELKVDEAKVTQALTEIREARTAERTADFKATLDQAVTDGKLTQTEADAVVKAADAGVISYGRGGRR